MARELAQVRYVACASTEFARTTGLPEDLEALMHLPLITSSVVGRELRLAAYKDEVRQEVTLNPTLASENFQFLREAILSGLGIGLVPSYVVEDDVKMGHVVTALDAWRLSIFGTRLFLLRMPGRYQTQAVRTFIDFIVEKASLWPR
ncbi:LysR substrate binding domain protein [compost metagenome]